MRLSLATVGRRASNIRAPAYDPSALRVGIVHLGVGAFQRAHQGVFTDDAIEAQGGAWGIAGVSMRKPDVADELNAQDDLYTVEIMGTKPSYRIVGALRRALCLPSQPAAVLDLIAAPATQVVTLTVTEKGYCLNGDRLDVTHPEIVHDWNTPERPTSTIGALSVGLMRRRAAGGRPMTVISCDNLINNGARLRAEVCEFAERLGGDAAAWIANHIAFPDTMVDSIVPATDGESRRRVAAAVGLTDLASVQREPFAQWVIEDRLAGPIPAWVQAGVQIVPSVVPYRRLKLHVLNATHSAIAYLGLERGLLFVRQAVADPEILHFVNALVDEEIAPGLPDLPVRTYWSATLPRFANPMLDHRLDQIAGDGVYKLAQRIYPLMLGNVHAGLPVRRLASIVWRFLKFKGCRDRADLERWLDDAAVFPEDFRTEPLLRRAVLDAAA
jgi:fructuronate reductase